MNLSNLPVVILFCATVYLSIVYGLLKIAETQRHNATATIITPTGVDSQQGIEVTETTSPYTCP
jgi:hypothetical protein